MRRTLRSWLVLPYMILLSAAAGYLGFLQPRNFLKEGRGIEIGRHRIEPIPRAFQRYFYDSVRIEKIRLEGRFRKGDMIFVHLRASGFFIQDDRAWAQVDLKVRDPRRNIVLDQANVINTSLDLHGKKYADLVAHFALHPESLPGLYEVEMVVHDRFAKTKDQAAKKFPVD